jgi:hypothetical protein
MSKRGVLLGTLWAMTLIALMTSTSGAPEMLAMAAGWTVFGTVGAWRQRSARRR